MITDEGPDFHQAFKSTAQWAELRARFPEELTAAQSRRTGSRFRVTALVLATGMAIVVSAIGIPQYLHQNQRPKTRISLAAQPSNGVSPRSTSSGTLPSVAKSPTKAVSAEASSKAPVPPVRGTARLVGTIYLVQKNGMESCGKLIPVNRTVSAALPISAVAGQLSSVAARSELDRGLSSTLAGARITTRQDGARVIVNFETLPAEYIRTSCRRLWVDEVVRRSIRPLMGQTERFDIRLRGNSRLYQVYLGG
jgi:hypothetical protein